MNTHQVIGSVCVAIAAVLFLLPLQFLWWHYAGKHEQTNDWMRVVLPVLMVLWLLLMVALLCVTASGGFDWLRLGRPALYVLTVGAAVALAAVSFALIGSYIRPGFIPSSLFSPPLYVLHLATFALVILSLHPALELGAFLPAVRWLWTIAAGLSLILCLAVGGYFATQMSGDVLRAVTRGQAHDNEQAKVNLAKIPTLDPQHDFNDLLGLANQRQGQEVFVAATARARTHPNFLSTLAAALEGGEGTALEFVFDATLSPTELKQLAKPTRTAIELFTKGVSDARRMSAIGRWQLRRFGTKMISGLAKKFADTDVDFAPALARFEKAFDSPKRDDD